MIHTLEDFCKWAYPESDHDRLRRLYYRLVDLSRESVRRDCYRVRYLPKKGGGTRRILAPNESLKRIQRAILPLLASASCPTCATAYESGCTVRKNALPHVGAPLVVKLDIRDFFGSIGFAQVYRAVDAALAASPLVGRHFLNAYDRASSGDSSGYNRVLSFYFARYATCNGVLVQGAPSSPRISNLVFAPIDGRIARYCGQRGIAYTRYSDDMTFSGTFSPCALIAFVRKALDDNGFSLHADKTMVLGAGVCHKVTGAVVHVRVQADQKTRRTLRQEWYYLMKFGVEEHLTRRWGERPDAARQQHYLRALLGRISAVVQLNPTDAEFVCYQRDCADCLAACVMEK